MKKGLLWAILIVLVLAVILFTLANKQKVEEGASNVLDNAESVIENQVPVEAEVDPNAPEGDATVDAEVDTTAEADSDTPAEEEEEPVVAEEDPLFQQQIAELEAEANAQ